MNQKKKLIIIGAVVLAAVVIAVLYFLQVKPQQEFQAQNAEETIRRNEIGLEFSYLAGPDALSLFEPSSISKPTLGAFIIMPSSDFIAIRNQEAEGETPPSISLFVFEWVQKMLPRDEMATDTPSLSKIEKLRQWAEVNNSLTGINEAEGEVAEVKLDGVTGLHYLNTGLYKQDVYIFFYSDKYYLFVGQYENEGDEMQKYFEEILKKISFN